MAQGQLFVASDVGGHKELVRNGETGWLFKSDNVDALTEGVLSMLNNQSRWPAIKAAGREYVETERSWKASVSRYQAVYSLLLQGAYGR
jgi:glycogen(starch) synthase